MMLHSRDSRKQMKNTERWRYVSKSDRKTTRQAHERRTRDCEDIDHIYKCLRGNRMKFGKCRILAGVEELAFIRCSLI